MIAVPSVAKARRFGDFKLLQHTNCLTDLAEKSCAQLQLGFRLVGRQRDGELGEELRYVRQNVVKTVVVDVD